MGTSRFRIAWLALHSLHTTHRIVCRTHGVVARTSRRNMTSSRERACPRRHDARLSDVHERRGQSCRTLSSSTWDRGEGAPWSGLSEPQFGVCGWCVRAFLLPGRRDVLLGWFGGGKGCDINHGGSEVEERVGFCSSLRDRCVPHLFSEIDPTSPRFCVPSLCGCQRFG